MRLKRRLCALSLLLLTACASAPTRSQFTFQSNFWLNLHHFLRVVARGMPAPAQLTPDEQETWNRAVQSYRERYAQRDVLRDDGMVAIKDALRQVRNSDLPAEFSAEPGLRETLIAAAPVYRKHWWPAHDAGNRAWIAAVEPLVARYGDTLSKRVPAAYGARWPEAPHPVDLSVTAGPVCAYTSWPPHSTINSFDRGCGGLASLEILFHEASHQWGQALSRQIAKSAETHRKTVPRQLWHAVMFYNAGELTRRALADGGLRNYVEHGVAQNIYTDLCGDGCRERVAAEWDRFLDGEITAEQALDQIVAALP